MSIHRQDASKSPRDGRPTTETRRVRIRYLRLPDQEEIFDQLLVEETERFVVTLLPAATLARPLKIGGRTVLETGSPVIWFTFPGAWHDVGLFHLADGRFTGYYTNILTPVVMNGDSWETTDLALDLWIGADGTVELLDREEFSAAVAAEWVSEELARRAEEEADRLTAAAERREWPPAPLREWNLHRVMDRVHGPNAGTRLQPCQIYGV